MKNMRWNDWQKDLTAILGVAPLYVVMQLAGITCPIKFITGVSCPGCGMTRAWLSLLQRNIPAAMMFHPLFWMPILALFLYIMKLRIGKEFYSAGMAVICICFLVVYLFRMAMHENTIVSFRPDESIIARLIQVIFYG